MRHHTIIRKCVSLDHDTVKRFNALNNTFEARFGDRLKLSPIVNKLLSEWLNKECGDYAHKSANQKVK